ncbi:MAG: P-II family nitrogen regulator, partial [Oscillospiraceae bacterium]|nr:P-II family nitrogen regulator [Oscillospiraceae bacterium]
NQGYTDVVMETARKAGARGGTIIRGRWAGDESFAQMSGITTLQAEKELIFIVVSTELRNGIMDAISQNHGLRSEAGAMVTAIGVEDLVRLG